MEGNTNGLEETGLYQLVASEVGLDFIEVTWTERAGICNVSHYKISHRPTTETEWQEQDTATTTSGFHLDNLDEDTEYEVKLAIVFDDGSVGHCTESLIMRTKTEKQTTCKERLPLSEKYLQMNEDNLSDNSDRTTSIVTLPQAAKVLTRQTGKPEALSVESDKVHLRWNSPEDTGVTYYEIKFKSVSDTLWKKPTFTDDESTSYCIRQLSPQTEYQFKVRAHYQEEEGEFSDVSNAIKTTSLPIKMKPHILSCVLPSGQPGKPDVLDVGTDNVCLVWEKAEDREVSYYEIKVKIAADAAWLKIPQYTDIDKPYKKISDLEPATEYEFKVRAHYNNGDEGAFSEMSGPIMTKSMSHLNLNTKPTPLATRASPRKPGTPTALEVGEDYVDLGWNKPDDRNVEYYEIKSKQVQDATWRKLSMFTENYKPFHRVSGLLPSTSYAFKVRANYTDEEGEYSETSEDIDTKPELNTDKHEPQTSLTATETQKNRSTSCYELRYRDSVDSPWCSIPILNRDMAPFRHQRHKQDIKRQFLDEESNFPDDYSSRELQTLPFCSVKPSLDDFLPLGDHLTRGRADPREYSSRSLSGNLTTSGRRGKRRKHVNEDEFMDDISTFPDQYSALSSEFEHFSLRSAEQFDDKYDSKPQYGVVKRNSGGNHERNVHVTVSTKPCKPTYTEVGSDYVWLFWGKPEVEGVVFYEVRYKPKKESMWNKSSIPTTDDTPKLLVGGLSQDSGYVFKVRAHYKDDESEFSEESDVIQTNQSPAIDLVKYCIKLQGGEPSFYKLPLQQNHVARNEEFKTRKCAFGSSILLQEKTIMMVGATGSGKSTLIDGMVNYLLGVKWEDNIRFKIIDITSEEEERRGIETESQTDWITSYRVHPVNETVKFIVNIIDTPGFGDTRGIERDKTLVDQIRAFFTTEGPKGIETIDVVCFVTQAPNARMTNTQRYIFDAILSIFGKDMADNIVAMVTFADGKEPPVLNALAQANVPYAKHFVFNNSALFEPNTEEKCGRFGKMFWEMGSASYDEFFTHLQQMKTQSLLLTTKVLEKRDQLNVTIAGLIPQIDIGLGDLAIIREESDLVTKFEREIRDNKNFNYEIVEYHQTKVPLEPGKYVTNCTFCHCTCHFPCRISNDGKKMRCKAMKDGICTVCPKQCPWDMHRNNDYRIEVNPVTVKKTYEEMKLKYKLAEKKKISKEMFLDAIKKKVYTVQKKVRSMLEQVRECGNYLRKYSIKIDPLTEVEYLELMIHSAKEEKKPGFKERIQVLNKLRRQAQITAKAMHTDNSHELLGDMGLDEYLLY